MCADEQNSSIHQVVAKQSQSPLTQVPSLSMWHMSQFCPVSKPSDRAQGLLYNFFKTKKGVFSTVYRDQIWMLPKGQPPGF